MDAKTRYRLIALDMDGTLLTEEKTVSEENRAALREAQDAGFTVVLSTGRGIQNVMPYIEDLGLKSPIVTVNGSEVWAAPGKLLDRQLMAPEHIRSMLELALHYDTWYWAYSVDDVFTKDRWSLVKDIDAKQWLKFGYFTENEEVLGVIRKDLEARDVFEITNSHPCNIEMNPKGINKASGLRKVCDLQGISMAEVIAMGDSQNDIAMLQAAGLGVAMGNAQDEVKALADVVTVTNEEHGVARIIREYMLKA